MNSLGIPTREEMAAFEANLKVEVKIDEQKREAELKARVDEVKRENDRKAAEHAADIAKLRELNRTETNPAFRYTIPNDSTPEPSGTTSPRVEVKARFTTEPQTEVSTGTAVHPSQNRATELRERLLATNARYLYDEDPYVCVRQLVVYSLNQAGNPSETFEGLVNAFDFAALYPDHWDANWPAIATRMYKAAEQTQRYKPEDGEARFIDFMLVKWLREKIPDPAVLVDKTKAGKVRQQLTYDELAFVLGRMLKKLIQARRTYGPNGYHTLARNFFLKKETADSFKRATGRKVNQNKLNAITNLLHAYGIVEKIEAYKEPNKYRIGPNGLTRPIVVIKGKGVSV